MSLKTVRWTLIGLWMLAVPVLDAGATDAAKPEPSPAAGTTDAAQQKDAKAKCSDCGTIVAIVQRIIGVGSGYFVYDIHVRMDKTGLLKTVTMSTQGALDKGERVHVTAGNDIVPIN